MTVIVQIIWRFRSVEFVYCWIPRTPVYARWIAVDGWRLLIILGIIAAYIRILALRLIPHDKKLPHQLESSPASGRSRQLHHRFSAIDSADVSNGTADGRGGLFGQSMHNIHRWAWSKLGLTADPGLQPSGVDDSLYRPSPSYYETFKRSFALNFVRRFFLTVDIPSPTISESIFDQIGTPTTHCDSNSVRSAECAKRVSTSSDGGMLALKRWYSAVSRLIATRRSQQNFHPAKCGDHFLRRSHTAPVLTSDGMGLCSCVFKRRGDADHSRNQTLATTAISSPPPCAACHPDLYSMSRSVSVKKRYMPDKCPAIFGSSHNIEIYACNDQRLFSEYLDSSDDESSAQIVQIEAVEKLVSLEDGHWTKVVERCRDDRQSPDTAPKQATRRVVSRLYVYPLAYLLVWLPSIAYYVVSTYVYYTGFQSGRLDSGLRGRSLDMSHLPAHWTPGQNMNRVWPYYQRLTKGVWGSEQLGCLAIIQSLHMLSGAVDALLFWLTE
ncbi:hypothetical protein IWW47_000755 [Coemansia sp. RSA 2052]|nr:hypothetical protein IWW47_000755 [Coemansia sp. RSA 2052]